MEPDKIFNEITNLPPEAQKQVFDFIAFLRTRYQRSPAKKSPRRADLATEPFIGIWKDREEMKESGTWLRNIRKSEWGEPGA